MNNLGSFFTVIVIVALVFTLVNIASVDIVQNNPNLDEASLLLIDRINDDIQIFQPGDLTSTSNPVTNDSSFEGTDAFAREFLQSTSFVRNEQTILDKITGIPDLIVDSLGVDNQKSVTTIKLFLLAFISFFLGLALYKAIRTGEVDG